MNLGGLGATVAANKKTLAVAGAAGAAGLALMRRKKAGGDVGTGTTAAKTAAGAGTAGGQVVYDSSTPDLYNAIQPQLETLGVGINQLLAAKSAPVPAKTIPVPAAPKPTAPKPVTPPKPTAPKPAAKVYTPGFFRVAGTDLTYQQDSAGNLDWISKAEGNAFGIRKGQPGASKIQTVAKDSTFWAGRKYLGGGPVPTKLK